MWLKIKEYIISLDDILYLYYVEEDKTVMVIWKSNIYTLNIHNVTKEEYDMIIPYKKRR